MNNTDGGPAFPVIAANGLGHVTDGMTLRDYFAAQAMISLIADSNYYESEMKSDEIACDAYLFADRMLAERAK